MQIVLKILLLLLLFPLLEIYLSIKVGSIIGAAPTIFLLVASAFLGVVLIRSQGIATLRRVRSALLRGELPTMALLEGVVLLICGLLLLLPGFVSDALALVGLIGPWRRALIRAVVGRGLLAQRRGQRGGPDGPTTIEGEYRHEGDDDHRRLR